MQRNMKELKGGGEGARGFSREDTKKISRRIHLLSLEVV